MVFKGSYLILKTYYPVDYGTTEISIIMFINEVLHTFFCLEETRENFYRFGK